MAIPRRQARAGFGLSTALAAATVSSCALSQTTRPVTLVYPPAVVWQSYSVRPGPAPGECASQLAADVERRLSSRRVPGRGAASPASERAPEATYVVEITETECGYDGRAPSPDAPGEKEVVADRNSARLPYPGRAVPDTSDSLVPGVFMIGATVRVSDAQSGRGVATLDVLRAAGGAGGGDPNFMARPASPGRARSMARRDLESFLFGSIEDVELAWDDRAECLPQAWPVAPDREDPERALSRATAALRACRAQGQSERLTAEALHNVGVIHLLRNDFVSALDFLGQALALHPDSREHRRAWTVARRASRRQAVVLPERTG